MGLFLSIACVIRGDEANVVDALRQYAIDHNMIFGKETLSNYDGCVCAVVASNEVGVTVLYPYEFFDWDEASCYISERLGLPVFSFHLHDEDLWMYLLFDKGVIEDQFNPIPDYWGELSGDEMASWVGDADEVSEKVPGIFPELVSAYLVRWGDEVFEADEPFKAYPSDRYAYGDCMQLFDFIDKLGLIYPIDDEEHPIGDLYRFESQSD
jgi:hypothetical protein